MFYGCQQGRPGLEVGVCEQKTSEEGKDDGDPVPKDDVDIGKDEGIDNNKQEQALFKKLFVAVKEEASKQDLLGKCREYGVEEHDGQPKPGSVFRQGQKLLRHVQQYKKSHSHTEDKEPF